MHSVRKQTWASCFGSTLQNALLYSNIIRKHNVCILGEPGTGKELIARAISTALIIEEGNPEGAPIYNAINAAAFPETLIESELFGHIEGSFTGAKYNRDGCILKSNNGVFFLDEVGDLPLTTQVKMLRVIQEGVLTHVGSDQPIKVSVRFVSASNKNLEELMEKDLFRPDFYYRIAGTIIKIPPLRERLEDIKDIIEAYIRKGNDTVTDPVVVMNKLKDLGFLSYHWPSNVRELQSVVHNILLDLPTVQHDYMSHNRQNIKSLPVQESGFMPDAIIKKGLTLEQFEKWYVNLIYTDSDNNKSKAARRLGINRNTLDRWIKKNDQTQ